MTVKDLKKYNYTHYNGYDIEARISSINRNLFQQGNVFRFEYLSSSLSHYVAFKNNCNSVSVLINAICLNTLMMEGCYSKSIDKIV